LKTAQEPYNNKIIIRLMFMTKYLTKNFESRVNLEIILSFNFIY